MLMINLTLKSNRIENNNTMKKSPPSILYHATFNALVPEIQQEGLISGGTFFKNFENKENGVYLAFTPGFAISMVQSTENQNVPEKWLDEIVILSIDSKKLDKTKLDIDPYVSIPPDNTINSYIYRGNIHPNVILQILNADDYDF